MRNIAYIIALSFLLFSCNALPLGIRKNFNGTGKMEKELFEKNGNAFVVTSMYANFSQVWTYTEDYRIRYDLLEGKIQKIDTTASTFYNDYLRESQKNFEGLSPLNCPELDGGLFLIRMNYNAKSSQIDYYSVNIKCLFDKENEDPFMRNMAKDIDFLNPLLLR